MEEKARNLILAWHDIYLALGDCIESARVVLDQSDRGTLLPDRVREMRGELLGVRERLPKLADLLEELTGEKHWPMEVTPVDDEAPPAADEETAAEAAEKTPAEDTEPPATAEGDYDASGSTPDTEPVVDEEAAAEEVSEEDDALGDPDATETP